MAERRRSELLELIGRILLPIVFLFANLFTGAVLVSAVWWAGQLATGHQLRGSLTESHPETVSGRRGQTLCYGTFQPDGAAPALRVRVVVPLASCRSATSRSIGLVPAVGQPLDGLLTRDDSRASGLDAVLGMIPMVLLDGQTLLLESWRYLVFGLFAVAYDVALVVYVRRWLRKRAVRPRFRVDGTPIRTVPQLLPNPVPHPAHLPVTAQTPPDVLFHGVARTRVAEILEFGIRRQDDSDVQLSDDAETARSVAQWDGRPVVFAIDAAALYRTGFVFHHTDDVWWVDHVPARFLTLQPV